MGVRGASPDALLREGNSGILGSCCCAALPARVEDPQRRGRTAHSEALEQDDTTMPKRTFQPNRRRRSKVHGFLSRMATKAGAAVLSRRRAKGRHKIAVSAGYRD